VPELAFPPKVKEYARTVTDRVDLEMLKDFALNEPFRSDVYIKGNATGLADVKRAYFEETRFGLLAPLSQVKREVPLTPYTLDFTAPLYERILTALESAPASAHELVQQPALADVGFARVADMLQNLVLGGQVAPVTGPADADAAALEWNRRELEEALAADRAAVIAAPRAGLGVSLTTLEAACLYVWTFVSGEKRKSWIRNFVRQSALPLKVGGKAVTDNEERTRLLSREVDRFPAPWRGALEILGVPVRTS
jgi:hypothetical protein